LTTPRSPWAMRTNSATSSASIGSGFSSLKP
jgi:hypothetical protein